MPKQVLFQLYSLFIGAKHPAKYMQATLTQEVDSGATHLSTLKSLAYLSQVEGKCKG